VDPHETGQQQDHGKRRRGGVVVAIIAVVVALIIITFITRHRAAAQSKQDAAKARGRQAVPVSVAPVAVADIPVYLDGLGNVNALSTVTVKTRIDGQLLRFDFQEGQVVHAGEELALIDPAQSEATLGQAEANRFKDAATLQNAQHDLARDTDLVHAGVISQQQFDAQQSQVHVNEGTVKADDAQIQQARLNVNYCHIKSPITGRIGIRFVDPGNMVHASDQNGLVIVTQMEPIAVLFTLPEDDLQPVMQHARAAPLTVEAWSRDGSQKIATGRLLTTDNQIDPNTGTFRCKATFDNSNGALFPNQFVNARLMVDVRRHSMTIPAAAVQHGAQGTYVYVLQPDQTVDMRPVAVALTEGTTAVLANGVQPSDRVVVEGADKLQPKAKVEIGGEAHGRGRGAPSGGGRSGGRRGANP
jgi:multidrug efflux system membrane fusion protein